MFVVAYAILELHDCMTVRLLVFPAFVFSLQFCAPGHVWATTHTTRLHCYMKILVQQKSPGMVVCSVLSSHENLVVFHCKLQAKKLPRER